MTAALELRAPWQTMVSGCPYHTYRTANMHPGVTGASCAAPGSNQLVQPASDGLHRRRCSIQGRCQADCANKCCCLSVHEDPVECTCYCAACRRQVGRNASLGPSLGTERRHGSITILMLDSVAVLEITRRTDIAATHCERRCRLPRRTAR